MRDVMMKAQELAEAILDSEIYRKMKQQEADVKHDPEAAAALSDMIEKRGKVEDILSSANMDANELADASREMEEESGKVFSRMDELRTAASEITILTAGIKNSIEEISRQAQKSSEESDTNSDLNAKVLDLLKSYKV